MLSAHTLISTRCRDKRTFSEDPVRVATSADSLHDGGKSPTAELVARLLKPLPHVWDTKRSAESMRGTSRVLEPFREVARGLEAFIGTVSLRSNVSLWSCKKENEMGSRMADNGRCSHSIILRQRAG